MVAESGTERELPSLGDRPTKPQCDALVPLGGSGGADAHLTTGPHHGVVLQGEPKPESGVAKAGKTWVREEAAADMSSTPCVFFQQGSCKYGDTCKFAHVPAQDNDGNVDMGEA